MIHNLKVVNGEMSLSFNELQSKYSVVVAKDVKELEFDYKIDEGVNVEIINNNLENNSVVELKATKDSEVNSYYFYILYEEVVVEISDNQKILEVEVKDSISPYAVPGIASVSFLLILFLFTILFHKKKQKTIKK